MFKMDGSSLPSGDVAEDDRLDDSEMPDGTTSIRMGSIFMQPLEEKDHYGLFRPLIIVRKDGGKVTRERLQDALGPLAVYRKRGKGDPRPENVGNLSGMYSTFDPVSKQMIELILVWRPPPKVDGPNEE